MGKTWMLCEGGDARMGVEMKMRADRGMALAEFMEWCVANPEAVIALGISLTLFGVLLRLLRR